MVKSNAFERYAAEYEEWFDDYPCVYESELEALRLLLPEGGVTSVCFLDSVDRAFKEAFG